MTTIYTNRREKMSFTVVKTRDVFAQPITPSSSEYETDTCEEEKLGEKADEISTQELIDSFVMVDIQNNEEQIFQPDGSQTRTPREKSEEKTQEAIQTEHQEDLSASSGPQSIPLASHPEDKGSMADVDTEEEKEEDKKKSKYGDKNPGMSNSTYSCVIM